VSAGLRSASLNEESRNVNPKLSADSSAKQRSSSAPLPRSGFVQPADGANDEERDDAAVNIERRWRAPRHGSSVSFGNIRNRSR
jgi:hypothetical protein